MSEEAKLLESIKKTQDLLGKYIKKPPLTEKLLKKPPFRFLHDIISAVIKETGFLKGLFTEDELNSSNITDKDSKLAYLTKLIDTLKLITGQELSAKPSKIVSGQEPIKTNELLQIIGKSLDKKISSSEAIEHYKKSLEKKKIIKEKKKLPDEKLKKSSSSTSSEEKLRKFRESEEKRKSSEERIKKNDNTDEKLKKISKKSTASERTTKPAERNGEKDDKKRKKREDSGDRREKGRGKSIKTKQTTKTSSSPIVLEKNVVEELKIEEPQSLEPSKDSQDSIPEEKPPEDDVQEPVELQGADEKKIDKIEESKVEEHETPKKDQDVVVEVKRNFLRPPTARPPSARPGAPKIRNKGDFVVNPNGLMQMGDVNVIVENFDNKEDDAEGMVVMESQGGEETLIGNTDLLNKELTKEHGYLVAQILETQRELVSEGNVEIIPNKVEIEWEAGMKKDKEAVIKEVDKLRGTIQTLTKTTNPLGKLMDFLQEDAEIMEKELWEWRNQFNNLRDQLVIERNLMRESIKPLEENLKEIEGTINGQMEKILQTKANIMKNNQKIQRLLSGK